MSYLKTIRNYFQQKLGIIHNTVQGPIFHVGVTLNIDPTPFILANGIVKIPQPEAGVASVEAVGILTDQVVTFHRLYLPGGHVFIQLVLEQGRLINECRWFYQLDEVNPSSPEEWSFWINDVDGIIGWPQFQTMDNKLYDRLWGTSLIRIQPRQISECLQFSTGTAQRTHSVMLYGAPTGLAAPAPQIEYVMVGMTNAGDEAWVDVHAGIDINPAAFLLS
jgi:hypothetical protein